MREKFQTEDEIREYFSHDRIICFECEKDYANLHGHLRLAHGIAANEYKVKYGIPLGYGLIGKKMKERISEHATSAWDSNEEVAKKRRDGLAKSREAGGFKGVKNIKDIPVLKKKWDIKHEKLMASSSHTKNLAGLITDWVCNKCGDPIKLTVVAKQSRPEGVMCDSCSKASEKLAHSESVKRRAKRIAEYQKAIYFEKKGDNSLMLEYLKKYPNAIRNKK